MNCTFIATSVKILFLAEGTPYLESGISLFSSRDPESESPKEPAHVCTTSASNSAQKISESQVSESFTSPAADHAYTALVETVSEIKPELTSSKGRDNKGISMVVSGLTLKEVVSVFIVTAIVTGT